MSRLLTLKAKHFVHKRPPELLFYIGIFFYDRMLIHLVLLIIDLFALDRISSQIL